MTKTDSMIINNSMKSSTTSNSTTSSFKLSPSLSSTNSQKANQSISKQKPNPHVDSNNIDTNNNNATPTPMNNLNTTTIPTSEDYLNKKIAFIQNHINNLLIEITNLPEPWTYAVTEDGRVFFINEKEQNTTWLHPKTGQPVSTMIIPPIEDLPNGWQKDYILGLPYLIDHNTKQNLLLNAIRSNSNYVNSVESTTYSAIPSQDNRHSNYSDLDQTVKMKSPSKNNLNSNLNNSSSNFSSSQQQSTNEQTNVKTNLADSAISDINITDSSNSPSLSINNSSNNNTHDSDTNMNGAIDSALRKYGWLHKMSQNGLKLWRKRYFVLTDYILDYYSDSTMSKHCGTIFLNNTQSRPTVKKDGSAFNKKNSFKVELQSNEKNANASDLFVYLAAESNTNMNEWINKFNFVAKLKDNNQNRSFYEKRNNRSSSNASIRSNTLNNSNNNFMVKHNEQSSKSSSKSNKCNSAPSSPNNTASTTSTGRKLNEESSKIRSSISITSNLKDSANKSANKKYVKKKLAFSDDEILNDESPKRSPPKLSQSSERLNSSYTTHTHRYESNEKDKHKRSSSLTKSSIKKYTALSSATGKNGSTSAIYDYKPIYDAFEKPIDDMSKIYHSAAHLSKSVTNIRQPNDMFANRTNANINTNNKSHDTYIDTNKISAAAAAAAAAMEKEREQQYLTHNANTASMHKSSTTNNFKHINNFFNINKMHMEHLPKPELHMLVRQLKRNYVLLNHSQQRFSLLNKLYEPYEMIYQHKHSQLNGATSRDETFNQQDDLTSSLHDSYRTMSDRIKKIVQKMDSVENSLHLAQQYEKAHFNASFESSDKSASNKLSSLLKMYEYQVVEMQHEYELLLEDKIIIEKLLDNQMRIYAKFKNQVTEKILVQQLNALNQEMDLLQIQLHKVNQLLNDTIAEKCKHELFYTQQKQQTLRNTNNSDASTLFRASLIPVGGVGGAANKKTNQSMSNSFERDSKLPPTAANSSSIWKGQQVQSSPLNSFKKTNFGSIDNLPNESLGNPFNYQPAMLNKQYQQAYPNHHRNSHQQPQPSQQPYMHASGKLDNSMSKSIESIYSPTKSKGSAFKPNLLDANDEYYSSFQPVNFTNNRPKQVQQAKVNVPNFKREVIAEKKRSSIGKNGEYFHPIPIHIQNNNQTARERLFGTNANPTSTVQQASPAEIEQMNSRKIAMVKPELRGNCENEMMSRFTQQNQMEYFNADYSEEIIKNIQKPGVFCIPRGNLDLEPDIELSEEERKAKEKRMNEIKKMIALQSLQQLNIEDTQVNHSNYTSFQPYGAEINYEKEKKAREQLLDLRHELAEQIKEKTRAMAMFNNSNGALSSSLSPSSGEFDQRIAETSKECPTNDKSTPNTMYSNHATSDIEHLSFYKEQLLNSTYFLEPQEKLKSRSQQFIQHKLQNHNAEQALVNSSMYTSINEPKSTAFHPIYSLTSSINANF